jgi:cellulose biosynthesis protein BcsQ
MGKIIAFFNHKGGVGKTTLVHNLGFILADRGYKVLLIDADPQMNLTAAMYGLSTSVEYSTDEDSKWNENTKKYISLSEHLNIELREIECNKTFFRIESDKNESGAIDLISGDINLSIIEADLFGVVKSKNELTKNIPNKFERSITKHRSLYDFIFIDTSPSGSSIINALMIMLSDYFIAPVSPSFFSLQAIDNLSTIFQNWRELLGGYETTKGFKGISFQPRFLGLVVQMAKRFTGGNLKNEATKNNQTNFSQSTEKWIEDLNVSVTRFQKWAFRSGMSISEEDFIDIFNESEPFIVQKCCDFTPQLRSIAEKAGVPVVNLTPELCRIYKDSKGALVHIDKPTGQYTKSFKSISDSYNSIADGLIKLLHK